MKKLFIFLLILSIMTGGQIVNADSKKHTIGESLICTTDYSQIAVQFLGSYADYNNEFGYEVNGELHKLGMGKDKGIKNKTFLIINKYRKGDEIIFYIKNPQGEVFRTGHDLQAKIFTGDKFWKVGFEDIIEDKSDHDYNDIMLRVMGTAEFVTPPSSSTPLPSPTPKRTIDFSNWTIDIN